MEISRLYSLGVAQVITAVVTNGARQATKYISEKEIIRATRRTYNGKVWKNDPIEVLLTFGRPNWKEREYIKLLKKAKEPFPVLKVRLKWPTTGRIFKIK